MKTTILVPVLFLSFLHFSVKEGLCQQNYTGSYEVTTEEVTLTLTIKQDGYNVLTGTMKSSNGAAFNLEGIVNEGIAAGIFSGEEGSLYFEAYMEGNDLTLSLIQPDEFSMPDYSTAQYFILNPSNQQPAQTQIQSAVKQPASQESATPSVEKTHSTLPPGSAVVKDAVNGFSFAKPQGWIHQQSDGQIILGHNTIPGLISVFPHQAGNFQELERLMHEGIQEEGVFLSLGGAIQKQGSNKASGYYEGYIQGEQARGYGIGLLNPQGGGIFVVAVSTPQMLGQEIIAAAENLAQNTHFSKRVTGSSDLVTHFAGEWAWTNGYRTEWMTFFPDGTYSDQSEASYSGDMTDGSGNITGNWGVAGQNSNRGHWTIQGTRDTGVITVINPDGSQNRYEYQVFVERGEKYYREYLINGYHYTKQKNF